MTEPERARPTGTVTFLFTDIEGSTRLWEQQRTLMHAAFPRQEAILRGTIAAHHGYAYKMIGDAFQAAFPSAYTALTAAVEAQRQLATVDWGALGALRIRMALDSGVVEERGDDYVGPLLNRLGRLLATAHGGQILLSGAAAELARTQLPPGVTLQPLGTYRLKDLQHAEPIYQAVVADLPATFPPLRGVTPVDVPATSPTRRVQSNLPAQLTRFIGRERAIADVQGLLEHARLLTLTGSGGTGKTRLALEVGAAVLPIFADGVWLVELAALSDGTMVAETMARVFSLPSSNQPTLTVLTHYLREKRLLLLLDNCEHLIVSCAAVAEALLRVCPDLHILATSREGLGVPGELAWPVPTLQLPDAEAQLTPSELATFEAVRLFSDRAALVSPGFIVTAANAAAVRQICARLDGIPLAIELAAARVKTLAVADIAVRLGDRFRLLTGGSRTVLPRHQTLRALIDWSYRLLTEPERIVLRQLAVFASGWTLEAAEAICTGDDNDAQDVLDVLTRLVDKSLVVLDPRREDTRYRLLETIRQYVVERLEDAEESAAVRDRHLDYMLALSERFAPQVWTDIFSDRFAPQPGEDEGVDQVALLTRLAYDLDNIRRALDWAAETGRVDEGLRVLIASGALFIVRAGQKELLARLQAMLEAHPPPRDAHAQTMAYLWIVHVYQRQGELDTGRVWLDKAETLIAQLDNPALQFSMLFFRMIDAELRGDYVLARSYQEQRQHLAVTHDYFGIGKELVEVVLVWHSALLLLVESDFGRALPGFQLAHAHAIKRGNMYGSTAMARYLGYAILYYTGNAHEAAERFRESLVGNFALGDKQAVAACLAAWAALAVKQEQWQRAARLFGASEALQEAISTSLMPWDDSQVQRNVATLRQALPASELYAHWASGRAMSLEQAIDDALTTYPLAQQ